MRLGIYGGTFNPPHNGHTKAAQTAIEALKLDKLLLIPDGIPPHKELSENSPTPSARLEMTRLAAQHIEKTEVSDMEISRPGKSRTVDTLRQLRREHPEAELFLLIGTDMLEIFESWFEFEEIFRIAAIGVFARKNDEIHKLMDFSQKFSNKYNARIFIIENDPIEISSSALRKMLPNREGTRYISDAVYTYIISNRYYAAKPEFSWLREKAYAMLNPKRVPHVIGVEEEAVKLAKRWGANETDAREAAILHDITKNWETEVQLRLLGKYDIMTDVVEKHDAKLLHSKTGAVVAKTEFASSDEVASAIYWHTTGRENMTLLEKVIYMADYIEPNRDFEEVEKLRELAYKNLDEAMIYALEISIVELRQKGIIPHERSQKALEWLQETIVTAESCK